MNFHPFGNVCSFVDAYQLRSARARRSLDIAPVELRFILPAAFGSTLPVESRFMVVEGSRLVDPDESRFGVPAASRFVLSVELFGWGLCAFVSLRVVSFALGSLVVAPLGVDSAGVVVLLCA